MAPDAPDPRFVMSPDGLRLATYQWGPLDAPPVVLVHGFASSGLLNWFRAGWTRDLERAGRRVIALDQRGHGASDKPHDPASYTMAHLVADVLAVADTYLLDEFQYVGYSLGARVGWQASLDLDDRITRAVLGGIPDGDPLTRFRMDEARAFAADRTPITDRLTATYIEMAAGIPGNDVTALVALVDGMRGGVQPETANPPQQPVLLATGTDDPILQQSRSLAEAAPLGRFLEIPGRHHFNAPTSRVFRDGSITFLTDGASAA